mgnify:CR=1 FL=1
MYVTFAKEIACKAHANQTDKSGKPYIEHIYAVANGVTSLDAKTVAYLHDIVEDTEWTLDRLRDYFPSHIVNAVDCLTRREDESYKDFIQRVKKDPLATQVKISDLTHNMDLSRMPDPSDRDLRRWNKYRKAMQELLGKGK